MRAKQFLETLLNTSLNIDNSWEAYAQPAYLEELKAIESTILPQFCYSEGQGFLGIGLIGMIGELALYTSHGDIFELGIGTSSLYLSYLAKKYKRNIFHSDIDATKFRYGIATKKHILPDSEVYCMKSDDFFRNHTLPSIAFAFIDGDHHFQQAKRDFWNTYKYVVDDGLILLHDTYPALGEDWIAENMCGDCYKLRQELEKDKRVDCFSFALRGQIGFTLVRKKAAKRPYYQQ